MIETLTNIFGTRMSFVPRRDIYNEKRERGIRHRICMASLVTGREVHRPSFWGLNLALSGRLLKFFFILNGDHYSLVSFFTKVLLLILNNYHLC